MDEAMVITPQLSRLFEGLIRCGVFMRSNAAQSPKPLTRREVVALVRDEFGFPDAHSRVLPENM
jgi:hypothetical protein